MNIKKVLFSTLLAAGCFVATAQQEVKTENVFKPHWYLQGQVGFQHTLGEIDWSDLNSFNAQVGLGYQFSKLWGARLSVNGFQSKAGANMSELDVVVPNYQKGKDYKWSWNYLAPSLDLTFNLTHALLGYNPTRVVDFNIYGGIGANFAWGNDDAVAAAADYKNGRTFTWDAWDGNTSSFVLRWGANVDFRLTDNVSLGLEASWNTTADKYNSKLTNNNDWYFNTLAGIKYNFGKTYEVRTTILESPCPPAEVQYVHDTTYVNVEVPVVTREPLRRDIFFVIRGSKISKAEMPKVEDVVAYLNKYPEAKVQVTGYADKNTGNPKINVGYAQKRADKVVETLVNTYGISRDRIISDSKGDTVQPYEKNELNRVAICIAE